MGKTGFNRSDTERMLAVAIDLSGGYPLCERRFESTQAASCSVVGISAGSLAGWLDNLKNPMEAFCGEVYKESEKDKEALKEIVMTTIYFQHLFSGWIGTLEFESAESSKVNVANLVLSNLYRSDIEKFQRSFVEIQKLFNKTAEFLHEKNEEFDSSGSVDMEELKSIIVPDLHSIVVLLGDVAKELVVIQERVNEFWKNARRAIYEDEHCKTRK